MKQVSMGVMVFFLAGILALIAGGVFLIDDLTKTTEPTVVDLSSSNVNADRDIWPAKDFKLMTLEGQRMTMDDFKGKVVYLNLWYAGCPPCVREMPSFVNFSKNQANNDVVVIAVNQGDDATVVRSFMDQYNVENITVLLDPQMILSREYGIVAYPTTFIIDEEGMIHYSQIGEMRLNQMHDYLELVRG